MTILSSFRTVLVALPLLATGALCTMTGCAADDVADDAAEEQSGESEDALNEGAKASLKAQLTAGPWSYSEGAAKTDRTIRKARFTEKSVKIGKEQFEGSFLTFKQQAGGGLGAEELGFWRWGAFTKDGGQIVFQPYWDVKNKNAAKPAHHVCRYTSLGASKTSLTLICDGNHSTLALSSETFCEQDYHCAWFQGLTKPKCALPLSTGVVEGSQKAYTCVSSSAP